MTSPAVPTRSEAAPRRRPTGAGAAAIALLAALAVVPLLASAVRLVPGWVPQGDDATIVLRGDDLFSAETPLVGMPSTVGDAVDAQVHHPGPLESQAIGLVAAVVDDPRVAVVVVTVVNVASALVALLWAHRLGGRPLLALAAVVTAALLWSLRGPILVTPFNPYVAVLPLLACMASLVAATGRRPWALTAAVLFGSWAAQAHLTTTGPVLGASLGAAAVAALRASRSRGQRSGRRHGHARRRLLIGMAALVGCWAFPLADVVINDGGNVRAVLEATGSLDDETLGAGRALDVVVQALAVRPVWAQAGAGSQELLDPPSTAQQVAAALLALGVVGAARAGGDRRPPLRAAAAVALGALAVGGALTARIPGAFFNVIALHNYLWLWPVTALLWVTVLAGAWHLAVRRARLRPAPAVVPATALAVVAAIAVASLGPLHRSPEMAMPAYVRALAPEVTDALHPEGRYLIDLDLAIDAYGIGTGLLRHLEHEGYDVRVPARFEPSFGQHRVAEGADRDALVVRVARGEPLPPDPAAEAIAAYRPPPALLEARDDAERALVREIRRRGGLTVGGTRIEPADADDWVRSGHLLAALRFRLLDPSIEALPATRQLEVLAEEPLAHVVVHLVPVDDAARG